MDIAIRKFGPWPSMLAGAALLVLLVLPHAGKTEPLQRRIQGTVRDKSGEPLRRVVVQLKNPKTLVIRSYLTGRSGRYHFDDLSTLQDYELKAQYQGRWTATKYLSRYTGGNPVIVNFTITPD